MKRRRSYEKLRKSRKDRSEFRKIRVQRFFRSRLKKKKKGWDFSDAPDTRRQGSIEHKMTQIIWGMWLGLVSNMPTLRDVEQMLEGLGSWARTLVPEPISDTTLDTEARRLDCDYLLGKLVLQVRDLCRSKMLPPVGLPCGVLTVDGKNLATTSHDADGSGHKRSNINKKWHCKNRKDNEHGTDYYLMPALRATLTSAEAKPCVYQKQLPPGTGESTSMPLLIDELQQAYGRSGMYDIIDADAGLTSLKNADCINEHGLGYVLGLKDNQPSMLEEAKRVLLPLVDSVAPEAQTHWENRNGTKIRRSLWRTKEMAGIETCAGTWDHLCQTWLVRQETQMPDGTVSHEDRYFVSSLLWNYLKPKQILWLVRIHWGVENDSFNSLDVQWHEDSGPWCTKGVAVWALGLLRLMAYNTAQILRRRRLREKRSNGTLRSPMRWRSLFKTIDRAIDMESEFVCTG